MTPLKHAPLSAVVGLFFVPSCRLWETGLPQTSGSGLTISFASRGLDSVPSDPRPHVLHRPARKAKIAKTHKMDKLLFLAFTDCGVVLAQRAESPMSGAYRGPTACVLGEGAAHPRQVPPCTDRCPTHKCTWTLCIQSTLINGATIRKLISIRTRRVL